MRSIAILSSLHLLYLGDNHVITVILMGSMMISRSLSFMCYDDIMENIPYEINDDPQQIEPHVLVLLKDHTT